MRKKDVMSSLVCVICLLSLVLPTSHGESGSTLLMKPTCVKRYAYQFLMF